MRYFACPGLLQVETFFRLIDSHAVIPRKWTRQQERVSKYELLGDRDHV